MGVPKASEQEKQWRLHISSYRGTNTIHTKCWTHSNMQNTPFLNTLVHLDYVMLMCEKIPGSPQCTYLCSGVRKPGNKASFIRFLCLGNKARGIKSGRDLFPETFPEKHMRSCWRGHTISFILVRWNETTCSFKIWKWHSTQMTVITECLNGLY